MSITDLIAIFHHRWSAPVLAELLRQKGSRFAALVGTLGVGREALRRTLDSLLELGLVARNPGYGHPLRPEYVLTRSGELAARGCAKLLESLDEDEVLLRKWSLPVLAALAQPARFLSCATALPGVTPRALALALRTCRAPTWSSVVSRTPTRRARLLTNAADAGSSDRPVAKRLRGARSRALLRGFVHHGQTLQPIRSRPPQPWHSVRASRRTRRSSGTRARAAPHT